MSIVSDTLDNASQDPAVDHLGTVTKKLPAYKFLGGTVNAFRETPFDILIMMQTMMYSIAIELTLMHNIALEMLLT